MANPTDVGAPSASLPLSLLHDHLDGGLRVGTVLELADEVGWQLPTTDPDAPFPTTVPTRSVSLHPSSLLLKQ